MQHFNESINCLMSNLLRSCVKKSIYDLVDLIEEYYEGNKYEGVYDIFSGLALPLKIHPVKFFMVSFILYFQILFKFQLQENLCHQSKSPI